MLAAVSSRNFWKYLVTSLKHNWVWVTNGESQQPADFLNQFSQMSFMRANRSIFFSLLHANRIWKILQLFNNYCNIQWFIVFHQLTHRLIRLSLAQLAMVLPVTFTAHSSCLNLKAESVWRCMKTIVSSSLKGQKKRMREFTELYLRIQLEKIRLISQSKLLVSEGKEQPEHERILSLLKLTPL